MRLVFADQLGPHFVDDGPVLLVESKAVLRRRRFHRAKAHLVLSALRHRAADAGVTFVQADSYADAVREHGVTEVVQPEQDGYGIDA